MPTKRTWAPRPGAAWCGQLCLRGRNARRVPTLHDVLLTATFCSCRSPLPPQEVAVHTWPHAAARVPPKAPGPQNHGSTRDSASVSSPVCPGHFSERQLRLNIGPRGAGLEHTSSRTHPRRQSLGRPSHLSPAADPGEAPSASASRCPGPLRPRRPSLHHTQGGELHPTAVSCVLTVLVVNSGGLSFTSVTEMMAVAVFDRP